MTPARGPVHTGRSDHATRMAAAEQEQTRFLEVVRQLTADEWATPSQAAGWSVQDVVAHQAASMSGMFGGFMFEAVRSSDIERTNEGPVADRRDWPTSRVLDEYETWRPRAMRVLQLAGAPGIRRIPVRVGELGWLPLGLFPSGMVFEVSTHLRLDIAPALGLRLPPMSAAAQRCLVEWMVHVAANLGSRQLHVLRGRTIDLRFTGAEEITWRLAHDGRRVRAVPSPEGPTDAVVTTPATDFAAWGTHRRSWHDAPIALEGDTDLARRALDHLRVI